MPRKNLVLVTFLLALVPLLLVSGCKKKKTTPPPPELTVTLVEAGEAPLQPLRYAIPPDTVIKSLLDVRTVTDATEDPDDAFGVLPGVRLHLHAGPTVSIPKGTRYVLRISKAEPVLPEGAAIHHVEDVKRGVEALRNMRGRFDFNDRGIVIDSDIPWTRGNENVHPRVTIMLGNIRSAIATIPLPAEPVGIGAVWEVRRPLRIWSARVAQVTRYQLVDREGDRFRVNVSVQQTAAPQIADLNPKLEMHVKAYEMHAKGHALADLGLPMALEADLESSSAAEIALVSPEKTEPMKSARQSVLRLVTTSER